MKQKLIFYFLLATIILFFAPTVRAAGLQFAPASATPAPYCTQSIDVNITTGASETSNGAQVYVSHNINSGQGETISFSGVGGVFQNYGVLNDGPVGTIGLKGFGNVMGSNQTKKFGTITIQSSSIGHVIILSFRVEPQSDAFVSLVAQNGVNILNTGNINTGVYTVTMGYCDSEAPTLQNAVPVNGGILPVTDNITFDLLDGPTSSIGSGVNINTLTVALLQNNHAVPFTISNVPYGNVGWNGGSNYHVTIDPAQSFAAEQPVTVQVQVSDRKGNIMPLQTIVFNNYSCAALSCAAGNSGSSSNTTTTISITTTSTEPGGGCIPSIITVTTTIPGGGGSSGVLKTNLGFSDLLFLLQGRAVVAAADQGTVSVLPGSSLAVAVRTDQLDGQIKNAQISLGNNSHQMFVDTALSGRFSADFSAPVEPGTYLGQVHIVYGDDRETNIPFTILVLPYGVVQGETPTGITTLVGAQAELFQLNSQNQYVSLVTAQTGSTGLYGFIVPIGTYRVTVKKDGYRLYDTGGFVVRNNVINRSFVLISPVNLFDPNVKIVEKVSYVSKLSKEPLVMQAAEQGVAPLAALGTLLTTAPAFSLLDLLSYLRFLFLQPVLLFGRRRRKGWGSVYNSLTRLPVDLAVVRLVDSATNKVVQTRVTDKEGRYIFFVNPGIYRIEVFKQGLLFPTKALQSTREDNGFLDIYHGEPIHVDEVHTPVAVNIPLDAIGATTPPRRVWWYSILRSLQNFLAIFSVAAGIISLVISPTLLVGALLVVQILFYFLFKRLSVARPPRNWGIVYEGNNKKPLGRVVARLFTKDQNKLVATELTDPKGRYAFLVGPNTYYVSFEKPEYKTATSDTIEIKKDEDVLIKKDVRMEKGENEKKNISPQDTKPENGV